MEKMKIHIADPNLFEIEAWCLRLRRVVVVVFSEMGSNRIDRYGNSPTGLGLRNSFGILSLF